MENKQKIPKAKMRHLMSELMEYEAITPMSDEERKVLRAWVAEGYSVHENGSMAVYEGGYPVDFLDVYREEQMIREELDKLDERGRENYIARLNGTDTIDNLREDLKKTRHRLRACETILKRYRLMIEVDILLEEWRLEAEEAAAKYRAIDDEELPFD